MYCICSDKSFVDIMLQQRLNPLPFDQMIECYTKCNAGCRSCVEPLRLEVEKHNQEKLSVLSSSLSSLEF